MVDQQILIKLATQVEAQSDIIKISVTLLTGFVTIISIAFIILCKWVWDLKQKTSISVSGADCERRNGDVFEAIKEAKKEMKYEVERSEKRIEESMEKMSTTMATQMSQLHDVLVALLKSLKISSKGED